MTSPPNATSKRRVARAIVIRDGQLLVMHRNKMGNVYDTLPGGGIEPDETPEQAVHRELMEETQVTISNPRLVFIEPAGEVYGEELIYLCDYAGGEPLLHPDSEETASNQQGQNRYEPGWITLDSLATRQLYSPNLKQALLLALKDGFPTAVTQI